MGVLVGHGVDAVVDTDVVVPARQGAAQAQHEALAGAGQLAGAAAGLVQAHPQLQFAGNVVIELVQAGVGQDRHLFVVDIAGDPCRGAHIPGSRAAQRQLGIELVVAVELQHAAAQQVQLLRLRIQLGVAHVIVGAGVDAAGAGRQIEIGRRCTVGHRQIDQAIDDGLAVDREALLLQVIALVAREPDIGRAGEARKQMAQAVGHVQPGDEFALRGAQAPGGLHIGHGEQIEAIAPDIADAAGDAGRALAGTALLGAAGVGAQLQAPEVLAGDEVDHATDRVGAIKRRGAVEQDLDALDGRGRDVVQIDPGVIAR